MIWVRVGALVVVVALAVLALVPRPPAPPSPVAVAVAAASAADPPATRVPLPPALPQMLIGREARETEVPAPTSTPTAEPQVAVVDYGFSPVDMVIHAGAHVIWVNDGSDGHDVTGSGPGGDWGSGPLAPAERYERQFALTGTFNYVCTIHPEMRGRVIVEP